MINGSLEGWTGEGKGRASPVKNTGQGEMVNTVHICYYCCVPSIWTPSYAGGTPLPTTGIPSMSRSPFLLLKPKCQIHASFPGTESTCSFTSSDHVRVSDWFPIRAWEAGSTQALGFGGGHIASSLQRCCHSGLRASIEQRRPGEHRTANLPPTPTVLWAPPETLQFAQYPLQLKVSSVCPCASQLKTQLMQWLLRPVQSRVRMLVRHLDAPAVT